MIESLVELKAVTGPFGDLALVWLVSSHVKVKRAVEKLNFKVFGF